MQDHISETIIVTVGMLGTADSGTGTAHIELDLTGDAYERSRQVGEAMSRAWFDAMESAVREFTPQMTNHFRHQANSDSDPGV